MSRRRIAMPVRGSARLAAMACLLVALAACGSPGRDARLTRFDGGVMGTTWSVKIVDLDRASDADALREAIAGELERINGLMSTYQPDSELSRFNAERGTGWFSVSADTHAVVAEALRVSRLTDGAFDVTVGPLVNLWGFGPEPSRDAPPEQNAIEAARERVGYAQLEVSAAGAPPALRKARPDLYVDLSAIAKGYAVDKAAELLDASGVQRYLVEVGGELRARGRNQDDRPWTVAVERPLADTRQVERTVLIEDAAIATSGDYRNFFEMDGRRYSHTIDPRTGWPVAHTLASVAVIAPTTSFADAMATAFMVLGAERGPALAEREHIAALFIEHRGGSFGETLTPEIERFLPGPAQ